MAENLDGDIILCGDNLPADGMQQAQTLIRWDFTIYGPDVHRTEIQQGVDEIFRAIGPQLTDTDVHTMLLEYVNNLQSMGEMDRPSNYDELIHSMKASREHDILVWFQGLLYNVPRKDLYDQVADMAMQKYPPLRIPHFTRPGLTGARPDMPSFRVMYVFVEHQYPTMYQELVELRRLLCDYFMIDDKDICIPEVFYTTSAWVAVMMPMSIIEELKTLIEYKIVERKLYSFGIKKIRFEDIGPPFHASAGQATQSSLDEATAENVETVSKKPIVVPKEEATPSSSKEEIVKKEDVEPVSEESKTDFGEKEELRWRSMSKEQVLEYLKEQSLQEAAKALEQCVFEGKDMAHWTPGVLRSMGLNQKQAMTTVRALDKLGVFEISSKTLNDGIHGHMEFHPLCMKIIDTPEFQRLRDIKKLGSVYYVYPGAMQSRFEHSLGVAHLAQKLVRGLQCRQPSLDITDEDVLCVTIAGLCQDLGRGPHSHLFNEFMHTVSAEKKKKKKEQSMEKGDEMTKEEKKEKKNEWKPEATSLKIFDYMMERNNSRLKKEMHLMGLTDKDILFIREQIQGRTLQKYEGRPEEKYFLYEIIGHRENGIDVVKWDDIVRDSTTLGLPMIFDYRRFIKHVRVGRINGKWRICTRDKDADDHCKVLQAMYTMGQRAYFHRVHQAIEAMLEDVLLHVDKSEMRFLGKERKPFKLSECWEDPEAFLRLDDSIFHTVEQSISDDLKQAREILQNIKQRRLYKMVAETLPYSKEGGFTQPPETELRPSGVVVKARWTSEASLQRGSPSSLEAQGSQRQQQYKFEMYFDLGPMGALLYGKGDPDHCKKMDKFRLSMILSKKEEGCTLRLFCSSSDEDKKKKAIASFEKWGRDNGISVKTF